MSAALSISPLCYCKHKPILVVNARSYSRMITTTVCCQNRNPNNPFHTKTKKEIKEDNKGVVLQKFLFGVEKLGKGLQDNLSPKHKGDWKDITLMSLSFAVYIYMSQKIVCAYCAWMSILRQPW